MQIPDPTPEHLWLHQLAGQWDYEHECRMGPDQPASKSSGTQNNQLLGKLWIVGEITGQLPDGGAARSIITLGYDPAIQRFVGSFVSSCMSNLWPYNGSLDSSRKVLTLDSEGPDFSGQGTGKYRDIIEFVDGDTHLMHSQCQLPDGSWMQFMTARYRRRG